MKENPSSFHIQTTPPHEIYALPFNENFCVQFIHIMKHFVLYLWFLGLCFMFFELLWADATLALGGGNDMAIDDPSGGRDLCVFASLNSRGILREPQSKKFLSLASCFGWHNSTENIHNRIE
jgi:hypothetical protein